jgi:hypothetical protein
MLSHRLNIYPTATSKSVKILPPKAGAGHPQKYQHRKQTVDTEKYVSLPLLLVVVIVVVV